MADHDRGWTAPELYVLYPTDEQLDEAIRSNEYTLPPDLEKSYRDLARKSGFSEPPSILFIDPGAEVAYASARVTKSGTPYIILDPNTPGEDILGILAHELGHLKNGDIDPVKVAKTLNDTTGKESRKTEALADAHAATLCLGENLAKTFEKMAHDEAAHPNSALEEHFHPPLTARISALRADAKREQDAGRCPMGPLVDEVSALPFSLAQITGGETVTETSGALPEKKDHTGHVRGTNR